MGLGTATRGARRPASEAAGESTICCRKKKEKYSAWGKGCGHARCDQSRNEEGSASTKSKKITPLP